MIVCECLLLIIKQRKGVINMNNLRKIGLSALAGSLATFSVNAADMSVSGSGSISFDDTNRGFGDRGNGFYMGDSLKFNASGETDNGVGVAVYYEIDGGALDDHNIKLSGDWGTLQFNGHGSSSAFGAVDDKTPNAYEEAWDSLTQTGTDSVINGVGGNDMIRYDSPDFSGVTVHAAMVMNSAAGYNGVYNDFGIVVKPEMMDGLEVGYAFGETEATAGTPIDDSTMYVTYAYGPVTIGYQESESDAASATNSDESSTFGISYQVTDDFSVSYNTHEYNDGAWTSDEEYSGISASYTMGGITVSGHMNEVENRGGSSTAADVEGYELYLGFAF